MRQRGDHVHILSHRQFWIAGSQCIHSVDPADCGYVENGRNVAVHCRAGIGRSGMVTAATLIALGYETSNAVEIVSASRGVSIPDTVEQGGFIVEFAERDR